MNTFCKRVSAFVVATALALSGLVGCGGGAAANEPKTAGEVYERYIQSKDHDNCHTDFTIDFGVSMSGMSMNGDIKCALDSASGNAHGSLDMSMLGTDAKTELYIEKDGNSYTQYSSDDGGKTWTKSTTETPISIDSVITEDLFKDAKLTKTDTGYDVEVSGKALLELLKKNGGEDLTGMFGSDQTAGLEKSIENSKIVLSFDKDCMLQSGVFNISYDMESSAGDTTLTGTITIDCKLAMGDYGKITSDKVSVPEDVKKNATDGGSISLDSLSSELSNAA